MSLKLLNEIFDDLIKEQDKIHNELKNIWTKWLYPNNMTLNNLQKRKEIMNYLPEMLIQIMKNARQNNLSGDEGAKIVILTFQEQIKKYRDSEDIKQFIVHDGFIGSFIDRILNIIKNFLSISSSSCVLLDKVKEQSHNEFVLI
ncbi:hypothetical protein [Legionella longbeachae]|uniref:hypothetical protein n=1 Tax=Legionella longbeachae TaxID=450 RepID=UPI0001BEC11C|nr:hypothetical protein [Legionella longbeachae]ARM35158.1 hypothetical protein B0B39_17300 [Legionella longbeachae]EEZ95397.1 hypothetical protein LLB_0568 [Legionella longbeachae D-4968]QEY51107.1 hypothetical protein FQU71_07480 [Legionella longbeachae]QIN31885.1 hypothetical protein GCB94_06840 [Legionella longbeachae]